MTIKTIATVISIFVIFSTPVIAAAATVQLPQTGQVTCYDSAGSVYQCPGTGQDGQIKSGVQWPVPRFTAGGSCVTDNLTGLVWAQNGNLSGGRTWQGALDWVTALNSGAGLCGYHDWRLSNLNELATLTNAGVAGGETWLNGSGFANIQANLYWSSTTDSSGTVRGWILNMNDGSMISTFKSYSYYVMPVRSATALLPRTGQSIKYSTGDDGELQQGAVWPNPRFLDTGNETVLDNLTGLIWTRDANLMAGRDPGYGSNGGTGSVTWQQALDYVKKLNLEVYRGSGDWRLPNRNELRSLADYSRNNPALPAGHPFINPQSNWYWSSGTDTTLPANAWLINMQDGELFNNAKSDPYYQVWAVRTAPSGLLYVTGQVNGSGGAVSCVTAVPSGSKSYCNVKSDSGYLIATVSGCAGQLAGNVYTTGILTSDCTVTATFTLMPPARIFFSSTPTYYALLQNAYKAGRDGDTIEMKAVDFTGNILFDRPVSIRLKGGYNIDYTGVSGFTELIGALTIGKGSATIENLIVK